MILVLYLGSMGGVFHPGWQFFFFFSSKTVFWETT